MLLWLAWEEEEGSGKQFRVNLEEQTDFYDHSPGGKYEIKWAWDFFNI